MVHRITATDPTKPYLGMTKAEVIACAGQPHSRYPAAGGSEILTYHYSGAGPVPAPTRKATRRKDDKKPKGLFGGRAARRTRAIGTAPRASCSTATRVVRISFAHKNVESPYAWQKIKDPDKAEQKREEGVPTCTFTLPNCPR